MSARGRRRQQTGLTNRSTGAEESHGGRTKKTAPPRAPGSKRPPRPRSSSGQRRRPSSSSRPATHRSRASNSSSESKHQRFYFQGDQKQQVSFKDSMTLRNHRADIVRIRKAIQHYTTTKYSNVQGLFRALDLDCDGVISMDDWVEGTKQLNFPITEAEARKLFYAIDVDSDNGLTYSEIVSVLEPSSFTSFQNGVLSEQALGKLAGFQTFTSAQAKKLIDMKGSEKLNVAEDAGRITPPPTSQRSSGDEQDSQADELRRLEVFKKRLLSRNQELHHLKSSIEWQLDQQDQGGMRRFLQLFREADPENRGYLNHRQFRMLLGERGMGLRINARQENLLLEECSDGKGAVEAKNFCAFLARDYAEKPDEMDASRRRAFLILEARTADMDRPLPDHLYYTRHPHRKAKAEDEKELKEKGIVSEAELRRRDPLHVTAPIGSRPYRSLDGPESSSPPPPSGPETGRRSNDGGDTGNGTTSARPRSAFSTSRRRPKSSGGGQRSARSATSARSQAVLGAMSSDGFHPGRNTWWANATLGGTIPKNNVDSYLATRDGVPTYQMALSAEEEAQADACEPGSVPLIDSRSRLFVPYRRPQQRPVRGWTGANVAAAAVASNNGVLHTTGNLGSTLGSSGGRILAASHSAPALSTLAPPDAATMCAPPDCLNTTFASGLFKSATPNGGTPSSSRFRRPHTARSAASRWSVRSVTSLTGAPAAATSAGETALSQTLGTLVRTGSANKPANQNFMTNAAFVPSPVLPSDEALSKQHPSKTARGSSRSTTRSSKHRRSSSAPMARTVTGLPKPAHRVLRDIKATLMEEPFKPDLGLYTTSAMVQPDPASSSFQHPKARFQRGQPDHLADKAKRNRRRHARAMRRKQAEEELAQKREQDKLALEEADMRRVVHRSRQQLRYIRNVVFHGKRPRAMGVAIH